MIPGPLYHQFPFWIELWALIMRRAMSVKYQSATSQAWLNTKEARQLRRPPFNQKQFSLFASLKWLTGPGAPSSGRTVQKSVVRDGVAQVGAQHSDPRAGWVAAADTKTSSTTRTTGTVTANRFIRIPVSSHRKIPRSRGHDQP